MHAFESRWYVLVNVALKWCRHTQCQVPQRDVIVFDWVNEVSVTCCAFHCWNKSRDPLTWWKVDLFIMAVDVEGFRPLFLNWVVVEVAHKLLASFLVPVFPIAILCRYVTNMQHAELLWMWTGSKTSFVHLGLLMSVLAVKLLVGAESSLSQSQERRCSVHRAIWIRT